MTDPRAAHRLAAEIALACPAMRSRALSRAIARVFDEALRDFDVKSSQFAILVAVEASGGCRPMDLADALSLSRAAATRAADVLERRGLLTSTERAATARRLELTEAGRALLLAAEERWREAASRIAEAIGALPAAAAIERA